MLQAQLYFNLILIDTSLSQVVTLLYSIFKNIFMFLVYYTGTEVCYSFFLVRLMINLQNLQLL